MVDIIKEAAYGKLELFVEPKPGVMLKEEFVQEHIMGYPQAVRVFANADKILIGRFRTRR